MNWKRILKVIGNKYVVATLVFVVVLLFLDEYNMMDTLRLRRQVNEMHAEERELRSAIEHDSIEAMTIIGNMDAIEHYGRENYYMKRADEDVFVVK